MDEVSACTLYAEEQRTLTEVAAYSKNGNRPDVQRNRSRRRPSDYSTLLVNIRSYVYALRAHPDDAEDVRVHIQCSLVHASW